ncbi:hypothetical protein VTJ04DRAFT_8480 [Mycothermus thermophilus]|uniref:uncharacterized protein n=1 Tax=Humicola insolens TaxID=85995 RepID=UPI003743D3C6
MQPAARYNQGATAVYRASLFGDPGSFRALKPQRNLAGPPRARALRASASSTPSPSASHLRRAPSLSLLPSFASLSSLTIHHHLFSHMNPFHPACPYVTTRPRIATRDSTYTSILGLSRQAVALSSNAPRHP